MESYQEKIERLWAERNYKELHRQGIPYFRRYQK